VRPILRSPATVLLVILAIPLVAFVISLVLPSPALLLWRIFLLAAYFMALVVLLPLSVARRPKRSLTIDPRANDRYLKTLAALIAVGIDSLSLSSPLTVYVPLVAFATIWVVLWVPLSMRAVATGSSVVIQRDPAAVFAFVADYRNEPRYISMVESVEKITSGPIGPGTQFRGRARLAPKVVWESVEEIVDYEPNQRVTSHVISAPESAVEVLTFEPAQGGTLLSHRFESEITYIRAVFGVAFFRGIQKRRMVAVRQAAWARLKEILESSEFDQPNA
jgi:polyketide cyclase/dehydrase/lipid transport protein